MSRNGPGANELILEDGEGSSLASSPTYVKQLQLGSLIMTGMP